VNLDMMIKMPTNSMRSVVHRSIITNMATVRHFVVTRDKFDIDGIYRPTDT
jgi:hypothetical protein